MARDLFGFRRPVMGQQWNPREEEQYFGEEEQYGGWEEQEFRGGEEFHEGGEFEQGKCDGKNPCDCKPIVKVVNKYQVHEVPHIQPVITKVINHHIYKHYCKPVYKCIEIDVREDICVDRKPDCGCR